MVDCRLVARSALKQFIAVFPGCLQARSADQPVIQPQNGLLMMLWIERLRPIRVRLRVSLPAV